MPGLVPAAKYRFFTNISQKSQNNSMAEFVVFKLDAVSVGVSAATVDRIVNAVEITPLPRAPAIALGIISVHGAMVPVVDFRQRLGLPGRDLRLSDRFVIARTPARSLVLVVDSVDGVFDYEESHITDTSEVLPGIEQVQGIVSRQGDIIFIHDLEKFLSINEAASLDAALTTASHGAGAAPGGKDAF